MKKIKEEILFLIEYKQKSKFKLALKSTGNTFPELFTKNRGNGNRF